MMLCAFLGGVAWRPSSVLVMRASIVVFDPDIVVDVEGIMEHRGN